MSGDEKHTVLDFPAVHEFLLCPKCDNSSWHMCWPKDKCLEWYVECCGCGQQYMQGLVTGEMTEAPQDKIHDA